MALPFAFYPLPFGKGCHSCPDPSEVKRQDSSLALATYGWILENSEPFFNRSVNIHNQTICSTNEEIQSEFKFPM